MRILVGAMTDLVSNAVKPYPAARIALARDPAGRVTVAIGGAWQLDADPPDLDRIDAELFTEPGPTSIVFDASDLVAWDSGLVSYLASVAWRCRERGIAVQEEGLPEGIQALLRLASTVPERRAEGRDEHADPFLRRFGQDFIDLMRSTGEILAFIGEVTLALRSMIAGRARFRRSELWLLVEEVGADALPIISLISFLVGLILGYIGDQQLAQFGARIFVADLVGLSIVIQMGALITAIVLAGRTGAAFAAQLGTMQVNEEIDALRTLGISPVEFLVLPRLIALVAMTPLLAIYANLMGILGGSFAGIVVGGLSPTEYFTQTVAAIRWHHITQGLISATVFGAIVAVSGCLRGMQSGRSAAAVGEATTSAVVTSIVFIVIASAGLTIVFDAIGLS
ncbi:MlaE family ABC transporter permease [Thiocapsa roseopersicina]|uniref:Phospholipid/cholesterol/gamma-HCH transport system permease protein n=1 Tax=Thiocapsa roseopersicina TaxID=1058 RepID=A0A1H2QXY8_THIRO|nr:ABC transporter permease [Thiocapsa roseopersicina]SDW12072.1 phospholipid/cholesterol/gamma-HCH transport system permease protein [Thiocapsa roseopersicina]